MRATFSIAVLLAALAAAPADAETYSVEVADPDQVAAIAAAREAHNAACPIVDEAPDPECVLDTNEAYVNFVMRGAVVSYEQQYAPQVQSAREALQAAEAAVREKYAENPQDAQAERGREAEER